MIICLAVNEFRTPRLLHLFSSVKRQRCLRHAIVKNAQLVRPANFPPYFSSFRSRHLSFDSCRVSGFETVHARAFCPCSHFKDVHNEKRTEKSEKWTWTVIDVSFLPVNHLQSPTKNLLVMASCSFNEISTFLCQKMFC